MQKNKKWIRLSIAILPFTLVVSACSIMPKEEEVVAPPLVEPAQVNYDVAEVKKGEIINRITGTATFMPAYNEGLFYEEQGGRLEKILVAEGDTVKKGQTLVEMDNGNVDFEIQKMEIEWEKAKIKLDQLKAQSADKYTISIAELDKESIALQLNELRNRFTSSQLVSPINGVVTFVTDVKLGSTVEPFQSLVEIADTSNLQLIYSAVSAGDIQEVKVGMNVTVTIDGKEVKGKVAQTPETVPAEVSEQDPDLYERSLLIDLEKEPEAVEIGSTAEMEIVMEQKKDTLVIPINGLRTTGGRNYVQVMVDETKREKDIEIGIMSDTEVEVLKGLEAGEKVILK
ncbi:efflux RND transporter periplasmic adaptor subunit [Radiobacillus kanasensis]|uniref:efflux RND transporter periplasmic adaptor subunit n=1 Tax=Radiobacillus kanasensis TaxID=2844358 RepID=UPI001E57BF8A|nr:efflux RND transporter periplasmic adaptor subunit [Radiobacillus kanasensis]UFT99661.1 efflux RND transporter periplasmic adaptor subunit [Radiobacillus kanasensis]